MRHSYLDDGQTETWQASNWDERNRISERSIHAIDSGGASGHSHGGVVDSPTPYTFLTEDYAYDAVNRLVQTDRYLTASSSSSTDHKIDAFKPNVRGELIGTQYNGTAVNNDGTLANRTSWYNYDLDSVGNRNSITQNSFTTYGYTQTGNHLNEYSQANSGTVHNTSLHQIDSYSLGNAPYTQYGYGYIADGRLSVATSTSNNVTSRYEMWYDALGRRVRTVSNGVPSYYVYDGERAIIEFDGVMNATATNVYGPGVDEILMRNTGSELYYHQDHEGSVSVVTDDAGGVAEQYIYDAFGAPEIHGPPTGDDARGGNALTDTMVGNRFMFTGREWTGSKYGFYEYRARGYRPDIGRFLSEDPKGFEAKDYNLYRYCHNDPLDSTDPMGMWGVSEVQSYSGVVDIDNQTGLHVGTQTNSDTGTSVTTATGMARRIIKTAKVLISGASHLVDYVRKQGAKGDIIYKGGKPLPAATFYHTWTSTRRDEDGLELDFHLRLDVYYATKAGPRQQAFAIEKEFEHSQDMLDRFSDYNRVAQSFVGRSYSTRTEAAQAYQAAITPAVEAAWTYSSWIRHGMNQHVLQEDGHAVDFYQ